MPFKPRPPAATDSTPRDVSGPVPIERTRSRPISPALGKSQPLRVLVIDDSELSRMSVADVLLRAGCQVYQLASPIGATSLILRHGLRAVIIDVSAPGLASEKMVAMLRANPRLRELAIILISANPEVDLEAARAATGANGALAKDRIDHELGSLLARVLSDSHERDG